MSGRVFVSVLAGLIIRGYGCCAFSIGEERAQHMQQLAASIVAPCENALLSKANAAEERWNDRFEQIKNFIAMNGHSNPSADPETRLLGIWVRNQRMQYKYLETPEKEHLSFLSKERVARLNSIGFVWKVRTSKWDQKYQELLDFRDRFGHCNVPIAWAENKQLGSWCSCQRNKFKKAKAGTMDTKLGKALTKEQIDLLDDAGFLWYPSSIVWWKSYESLRKFKERFGHCHVPQTWEEDTQLGRWVRHQKRVCREYVLSITIEEKVEGVMVSGLNMERVEALRNLDFCWLPDPKHGYQQPPDNIFGKVEPIV